MRVVTKAYLDEHRTERYSWTKAQIEALGVTWPPRHGWPALLEGKVLDDETAARFESGRFVMAKSTLRQHAKQAAIAEHVANGTPIPAELMPGYQPPPTTPRSIRKAEKKKARKAAREAKVLTLQQKLKAAKTAPKYGPPPKPAKQARATRQSAYVNSDDFLSSYEWRRVRMVALKKYGARCQCCGASPETGAVMNVDHIKPRRLFPQLALDVDNLQVLCGDCNHGKGNWDMTDWRPSEQLDESAAAHLRSIMRER